MFLVPYTFTRSPIYIRSTKITKDAARHHLYLYDSSSRRSVDYEPDAHVFLLPSPRLFLFFFFFFFPTKSTERS